MTGAAARSRDGPHVGCAWIIQRAPERSCRNDADVIIRSAVCEIAVCASHHSDGMRHATAGGHPATVRTLHPDQPTTLF